MTIWFASCHRGTRQWAADGGFAVDHLIPRLEPAIIGAGDVVIGSLQVHLVAGVCGRGRRYLHLPLTAPEKLHGQELSAGDLRRLGASLHEFRVIAVD